MKRFICLIIIFILVSMFQRGYAKDVTVITGFTALSPEIAFNHDSAEFLIAGAMFEHVISFIGDSNMTDMQLTKNKVPEEPGFYVFRVDVRDNLTDTLMQALCYQKQICVMKLTDYPYMLPATPNPAFESTMICFYTPTDTSVVHIDVTDINGTQQSILVPGVRMKKGVHGVICPCVTFANGVYLYRFSVDSIFVEIRQFTVQR